MPDLHGFELWFGCCACVVECCASELQGGDAGGSKALEGSATFRFAQAIGDLIALLPVAHVGHGW